MFQDFKTEIKLLLIVAFAAVAISVGGIFLLQGVGLGPSSPTPVPVSSQQSQNDILDTIDWQIYRNEEYGFEIKYPNNYFLSGSGSGTNVAPLISSDYATLLFRDVQGLDADQAKSIVINGISAIEMPLSGNMDGGIEYEVLIKSAKAKEGYLDVLFSAKRKGYENKLQEFKDILSTFKFIPQDQDVSAWLTHRTGTYEFKYPKDLGLSYVRAHSWPPTITVTPAGTNFSCGSIQGFGNRVPLPHIKEQVVMNGTSYCVVRAGEGAAGTMYETYKYAVVRDDRVITMEFVVRSPISCSNYSSVSEVQKCQSEKEAFNPATLADQIISTFRFIETPEGAKNKVTRYLANTSDFGYEVESMGESKQVEDLDGDGYEEFLVTASGSGGSCFGGTNYRVLYSPNEQEYFVGARSIMPSLHNVNKEQMFCTILEQGQIWDSCKPNQYVEYICFSNNLKKGESAVLKQYLERTLEKF